MNTPLTFQSSRSSSIAQKRSGRSDLVKRIWPSSKIPSNFHSPRKQRKLISCSHWASCATSHFGPFCLCLMSGSRPYPHSPLLTASTSTWREIGVRMSCPEYRRSNGLTFYARLPPSKIYTCQRKLLHLSRLLWKKLLCYPPYKIFSSRDSSPRGLSRKQLGN